MRIIRSFSLAVALLLPATLASAAVGTAPTPARPTLTKAAAAAPGAKKHAKHKAARPAASSAHGRAETK